MILDSFLSRRLAEGRRKKHEQLELLAAKRREEERHRIWSDRMARHMSKICMNLLDQNPILPLLFGRNEENIDIPVAIYVDKNGEPVYEQ